MTAFFRALERLQAFVCVMIGSFEILKKIAVFSILRFSDKNVLFFFFFVFFVCMLLLIIFSRAVSVKQ